MCEERKKDKRKKKEEIKKDKLRKKGGIEKKEDKFILVIKNEFYFTIE